MAKKEKVDQSGFQFDPNDFKTGNFLIDGQIKNIVEKLNEADLTGDGIADVSQLASVVFKFLPALAMLDAAFDEKGFQAWFVNQPFIIDKQNASNFAKAVSDAAAEAGKLFPNKVAGK